MDELRSRLSFLKLQEGELGSKLAETQQSIVKTIAEMQSKCKHDLLTVQKYWEYHGRFFDVRCSGCAKIINSSATTSDYDKIKEDMPNSVFFEK